MTGVIYSNVSGMGRGNIPYKNFTMMKLWWSYMLSINDEMLLTLVRKCVITHWGQVTHICVRKLINIGSDNGLSPGRCQTMIWTNAEILLIDPLGTNFSGILIGIQTFSFKKIHLIMSGKWRPFCLGLDGLILQPTAFFSGKILSYQLLPL